MTRDLSLSGALLPLSENNLHDDIAVRSTDRAGQFQINRVAGLGCNVHVLVNESIRGASLTAGGADNGAHREVLATIHNRITIQASAYGEVASPDWAADSQCNFLIALVPAGAIRLRLLSPKFDVRVVWLVDSVCPLAVLVMYWGIFSHL